jgi:dihydropteroate synthase
VPSSCGETADLTELGYTVLLSASNKRFLGDTLGLEIDDRREVSLASVAYGVAHGCRIVRAPRRRRVGAGMP